MNQKSWDGNGMIQMSFRYQMNQKSWDGMNQMSCWDGNGMIQMNCHYQMIQKSCWDGNGMIQMNCHYQMNQKSCWDGNVMNQKSWDGMNQMSYEMIQKKGAATMEVAPKTKSARVFILSPSEPH